MDEELTHLRNVHVGAVEQDGEVVFLHKMMEGPADKSYGIHVAKIAGLPDELLKRADIILTALEEGHIAPQTQSVKTENNVIEETQQLSLFNDLSQEEQVVVDKLKKLNVFEMNPIDAMKVLYELQQQLQK